MYHTSNLPNTRIDVADALRGIAVAGIILYHSVEHFNIFTQETIVYPLSSDQTVADVLAWLLSGKMYGIFAMLFGLSFFIMNDNQAQKGRSFSGRFAWRMCLLFLFGVVNVAFYDGDILMLYAVYGLFLIPVSYLSSGLVWLIIGLLVIQPVELYCLLTGYEIDHTRFWEVSGMINAAHEHGTFWENTLTNLRYGFEVNLRFNIFSGRLTQLLCLFIIGMQLGRQRLFYNEGNHLKIWHNVLWISALVVIILSLVDFSPIALWLTPIYNFIILLMIVSAVVSGWYAFEGVRRVLHHLCIFGRMSLTNYLLQSIIGCAIFCGYGLGCYRLLGITYAVMVGAGMVICQYLFARFWFSRHQRGPLEGFWRKLTWMKFGSAMVLMLFCSTTADAQQRDKYEFMRNLPVYADSLIADLNYPLAWGNSDVKDFDAWRKVARQKVFDCMLTPPPPPANDYDAKVLFEEQRDGYKARKIEIRLSRYYTVPAYVLIPDGKGPFPAVNLLHDHGAHLFIGKEKVIRPLACEDSTVIKDAEAWLTGYGHQFFGDYLAKNGFVVFAADAPMWGERGQKEGPRRDRYDMIAGNMMMYGIDLSAYMTYDDIAGTEYLATLPEVDASRIGCTGWSMGAYRAWMLAALSDRIKASASICWMVTTDEQMSFKYNRTENGGFANCFPGLRRWLDYPHVASIACPKAMLFINGSQDKLFPVAGVQKAFDTMHTTWQSQGADDKLETEIWDIPHSCPVKAQERVLEFFQKHL